jgi:hypothetical protein
MVRFSMYIITGLAVIVYGIVVLACAHWWSRHLPSATTLTPRSQAVHLVSSILERMYVRTLKISEKWPVVSADYGVARQPRW